MLGGFTALCCCVEGSNFSSSHYGGHRTDSVSRRPAHGPVARHEVVLKTLPFFDIVTEIMKPSSLGMTKQTSVLLCLLLCCPTFTRYDLQCTHLHSLPCNTLVLYTTLIYSPFFKCAFCHKIID